MSDFEQIKVLMKIFCIILIVLGLNVSFGYSQLLVNAQTESEIYISVIPEPNTAIVCAARVPGSSPIKLTYDSTAKIAFSEASVSDFGKRLFSGSQNHDIKLHSLTPASDFVVDYIVYDKKQKKITKIDSISINTLAIEPLQQARAIAFKNKSYDNVGLLWIAGNGDSVIVLASENSPCDLPKDGTAYLGDLKFGNPKTLIPGTKTFVLYSGANTGKLDLKVTGLKYAEYHFRILDYNGSGKYANYLQNGSEGNPRQMFTLIPPPINLRAMDGPEGDLVLSWDKVEGAKSYVVDIARDEQFVLKVEPYVNANIGEFNEVPIVPFDEVPEGKLFCRVRSVGESSVSQYSKVFIIELKQ